MFINFVIVRKYYKGQNILVFMEIKDLKERARIFVKNGIRVFVKDIYNNFYFCEIKEIKDEFLIVRNFAGSRNGTDTRILWLDILEIQEYREVGEK